MQSSTAVLFLLVACSPAVQCLRILLVFPGFGKSHHVLFHSIAHSLAKAGHDVVLYSPFPIENPPPNCTNVYLDTISTDNPTLTKLFMDLAEMPRWESVELFLYLTDILYSDFINSPQIQQLLVSKEQFDVVFTEATTAGEEFTVVLGHIFKAPVIVVQTFVTNSIANYLSGNSLSIPFLPSFTADSPDKMNFFQRLQNAFVVTKELYFVYINKLIPKIERTMRKDFPNAPPLWNMLHNISLIVVNDHPTAQTIIPRTPNIIPIGGIHIESLQEKPLPQDIKKFMDESKHGVILFSLGTYVRDDFRPEDYFKMYIRVFKQLKQSVIWKTRSAGAIKGLPDNVMTVKWAPQREFLAHPNAAVFLTHGGQFSTLEVLHYGVPVVCVPQFWDQFRNCRFFEERGVGVTIDHKDLSEETILDAFRKVVDNPSYKDNMKRLSDIFRDRPLSATETLVYWTEYVARHHGAAHLKPASTLLSWYQLHLLDVIAVIIGTVICIIVTLYLAIKKIVAIFRSKNVNKLKKS